MKLALYLLIILSISSCKFFKKSKAVGDESPIARAFDNYLYPSELSGLNISGLSKEDSTQLVNKIIREWAKQQVIVEKALENDNIDIDAIELKAEELKYQLIIYEFQKSLISSNLDTLISKEEIEKYYNKHKSDFELKQTIIKGYFVKIQKDSPNFNKFKTAFLSNIDSEINFIREYCLENADQYTLNDSMWFNYNDVVAGSPYQTIDNQASFLRHPSNTSKDDGEHHYFLRVIASKMEKEISPLQFREKEISNIIYNQRKLELIKNVEEKLFKEALDDQSIEYYK